MDALESDGRDRAAEKFIRGRGDLDILGTDNDIDRFILFKAGIDAFVSSPLKFDAVIRVHDAGDDIAFPDEARRKGVHRLVIDILRRADLLDHAAVHDDDGIAHRERLLLIMRNINKRDAEPLLNLFEFKLHLLAQF